MKQIPIQLGNDRQFPKKHESVANFSSEMIVLHERLAHAKAEADRLVLERQIKATDKKIDQLVYELYGLTNGEIRIIEES